MTIATIPARVALEVLKPARNATARLYHVNLDQSAFAFCVVPTVATAAMNLTYAFDHPVGARIEFDEGLHNLVSSDSFTFFTDGTPAGSYVLEFCVSNTIWSPADCVDPELAVTVRSTSPRARSGTRSSSR